MKNQGYQGWTLFDKVIIVAKKEFTFDYKTGDIQDTGIRQGYIVTPGNKSMLETATRWAMAYKSIYDENRKYIGREEIPGEVIEFDNNGWTLELRDSAAGSSQGGKLSFWNCLVTKDGQTFKVGIAADLLLDLLKNTTTINGVVQDTLCFARMPAGVGMLHTKMPAYQQALADMQKKADVKKKKTSKHLVGHVYSALVEVNAYAADIYQWYKPIYERHYNRYGSREDIVAFQKLDKPIAYKWFPSAVGFENGTAKVSDFFGLSVSDLKEKLPARMDEGACVVYDISVEDCIAKYEQKELLEHLDPNNTYYGKSEWPLWDYAHRIGLSTSAESYELSQTLREALIRRGYKIID